ncbi:ABC transporter permease [uncultured Victivallis sp.]|uniref:ABC transporter permease n=1 Tax=uncultured Victivallis sp. TaxID=354118 RepID=UPI0025FB642E|nr:ABC transporter permease [uncultured Victivallis sp.]
MKVKMNWKSVRDSGGVWIALVVFLVAAAISNENFRSPQNLVNITRQVSYSGIIALGMTFVIAAGGIDLAVGSLFALAGVVSLFAMNAAGGPESVQLVAGLGAALGVGVIGGALNGVLVGAARVQPFIVTLGTMSIFRSLALYFSNAGLVRTDNTLYQKCGMAEFGGIPLPTILLFVLTACLTVVLKLTRFGRHVCAVGSNERVAYYSAIRTGLVKFWTYVLVGGLAGLSAFLLGGRLNSVSSSGAGLSYELDAIAAVIIGGTAMTGGKATIPGTLAGVLLLGIVSNVLDMWGISVNLQGTVKGLVIIIAVLIQYRRKD